MWGACNTTFATTIEELATRQFHCIVVEITFFSIIFGVVILIPLLALIECLSLCNLCYRGNVKVEIKRYPAERRHCVVCYTESSGHFHQCVLQGTYCCADCFKDWVFIPHRNTHNPGSAHANCPCFNACGATLTVSQIQEMLLPGDFERYCLGKGHRRFASCAPLNPLFIAATRNFLARNNHFLWCLCGEPFWMDMDTLISYRDKNFKCLLTCHFCNHRTCVGVNGCGKQLSLKRKAPHKCNRLNPSHSLIGIAKCLTCGVGLTRSGGCRLVRCTVCNTMNNVE